MASVKWLKRIIITDRPFDGYFQTLQYTTWERRHGVASLVPVSTIAIKAQIARPAPFEVVPRATAYRMHGAAWSGDADVAKVEVSDDGGKAWREAKLIGKHVPLAWRFWEYPWQTPAAPGRCIVMARATDTRGRVQPMKRDPDLRDAAIHHVLPIEIEVRA
jgi:DMSO/TMAO reductase YedYZ molybdopterin-dependent catalytic subunit